MKFSEDHIWVIKENLIPVVRKALLELATQGKLPSDEDMKALVILKALDGFYDGDTFIDSMLEVYY